MAVWEHAKVPEFKVLGVGLGQGHEKAWHLIIPQADGELSHSGHEGSDSNQTSKSFTKWSLHCFILLYYHYTLKKQKERKIEIRPRG